MNQHLHVKTGLCLVLPPGCYIPAAMSRRECSQTWWWWAVPRKSTGENLQACSPSQISR